MGGTSRRLVPCWPLKQVWRLSSSTLIAFAQGLEALVADPSLLSMQARKETLFLVLFPARSKAQRVIFSQSQFTSSIQGPVGLRTAGLRLIVRSSPKSANSCNVLVTLGQRGEGGEGPLGSLPSRTLCTQVTGIRRSSPKWVEL